MYNLVLTPDFERRIAPAYSEATGDTLPLQAIIFRTVHIPSSKHIPSRRVARLSLSPELDTCKFKISGFLMLLVKLLRCQIIQP